MTALQDSEDRKKFAIRGETDKKGVDVKDSGVNK